MLFLMYLIYSESAVNRKQLVTKNFSGAAGYRSPVFGFLVLYVNPYTNETMKSGTNIKSSENN